MLLFITHSKIKRHWFELPNKIDIARLQNKLYCYNCYVHRYYHCYSLTNFSAKLQTQLFLTTF